MTLAFSLASPFHCLQVSDRLVTANRVRFDAEANKTLLCRFSDAVVAVAYSGPAFLDGVPTDQWIARRLRGEGPELVRGLFIGTPKKFTDIGQGLEDLRVGIEEALSRLGHRYPRYISIAVVGWQWHNRGRKLERIRPIVTRLEKAARDIPMVIDRLPRRWDHGASPGNAKFALLMTPWPNDLAPEEIEELRVTLRDGPPSLQYREEALVSTVAKAASRPTPVVGKDCMCIRIPPPGIPKITIAYKGVAPEKTFPERSSDPVRGTWTPWVVGQTFSLPPSFSVGPPLGISNFFPYESVEFEITEEGNGFGYFGTQPRPRGRLRGG